MFKKLLIANRGEIAVRIIRACRDLEITSVAIFSDADRASLHARMADEAYSVGPAQSRESYLCIDKIIKVAQSTGCDAIHPGYGFLSEDPAFARACAAAGIVFVGPSASAMAQLGSKTAARELASKVGVAVVPGALSPIDTLEKAQTTARELGYPVLLKAVAGGGGKGMRKVPESNELETAWRDASSEALNAFGDARLYLECYLIRPRHIEIQIVGDALGNMVYLGERECSVQRRHQKVIEEAPSQFVTPELRRAMGEAAVRLARAAGYSNAGTVEFLVDENRNFYFLEVNTRLQVEHPVTEFVTGIDLVQLQLQIAAGEPLPFAQDDIMLRGHAIECRIYAEDPENNFFPSPGQIGLWQVPHGPGIRTDEGVYAGYVVPGDYDPLVSKLISSGASRQQAISRLRSALSEFVCSGIKTNAAFISAILADPEFTRNEIHTSWLDERVVSLIASAASPHLGSEPNSDRERAQDAAAIAVALWYYHSTVSRSAVRSSLASRWKSESRWE